MSGGIAECETCGVLVRGSFEEASEAAEAHDDWHEVRVRRVATDGGMVLEADCVLPFSHTYLKHERKVFPTLRRRDKFGDVGDTVAVGIGQSGDRERVGTAEIVAKEYVSIGDLPNSFFCYDTGTSIRTEDAAKRAYESLNGFYQRDIRLDESLTLYWLHWLEHDLEVFGDV